MEPVVYQWTKRDKRLYLLSMLPFVVVFVGTAYLLVTYSIYILFLWMAMYAVTNIFQAGCCVGCPYRGKYCPALCGVYLGNLLSKRLYGNRPFDPKFFALNAAAGETMLLVMVIFPLYWVFTSGWYLVPVYLALIATHIVLFMPTQCGKCGYNTTCPGGRIWRRWRGRFIS